MRNTQSISVTLPKDLADLVESKIRSGEYADESDVIREGLRSLAVRDATVEAWLLNDVVPTYDAVCADRERALSADETWSRSQRHMEGGAARTPSA